MAEFEVKRCKCGMFPGINTFDIDGKRLFTTVQCDSCKTTTACYPSPEKAVLAWNKNEVV